MERSAGPLAAAVVLFAAAAWAGPERVLEDFEAPGKLPGKIVFNPGGEATATRWTMSVVPQGLDAGRALVLGIPVGSKQSTVWRLDRTFDLGGWDGFSIRMRSTRPLRAVRISLVGGEGAIFVAAATGTAWTESRWRFEESFGLRRFDRRRISAIAVDPADDSPAPVELALDQIAAFRDPPGTPVRRSLRIRAVPRINWINPTVEMKGGVNVLDFELDAESARLTYFADEPAYERGRQITFTWGALPHDLTGCTALRFVLSSMAGGPAVILKVYVIEGGGEQFQILRDAPVERRELVLPFDEFMVDAAANNTVGAGARNGVLDVGAVDRVGIEVLPLTEEPVRGSIDIQEAWAIRN